MSYQIVECKTNKELPLACRGFGKVKPEVAVASHVKRGFAEPEKVFVYKGESYIAVTPEEFSRWRYEMAKRTHERG